MMSIHCYAGIHIKYIFIIEQEEGCQDSSNIDNDVELYILWCDNMLDNKQDKTKFGGEACYWYRSEGDRESKIKADKYL
jgi:hypothetical protein